MKNEEEKDVNSSGGYLQSFGEEEDK